MGDIRPLLGDILDGYERLTYKVKTALSEFVDNSTASFFNNKTYLLKLNPNYKLKIEITYNPIDKTIEIFDDAMGMNREELYNALKIAQKPSILEGRNEFGMGLKTAASWFSKKWSVITKRADENYEYRADVDIIELKTNKYNDIYLKDRFVNNKNHYTIIRLTNLTRSVQERQLKTLMEELSSIYRKDILSGDIIISLNSKLLEYEPDEILSLSIDGVEQKKQLFIDEIVHHQGKQYPIKGFIGILKNGSYKKAGLTLLRRNRVIIGGLDKNYKPYDLFKSANSFYSLRVFGEISLDSWPVTQAKDSFDWETNGLEEAFIEKISNVASDIFQYAAKSHIVEKENQPLVISEEQLIDFRDNTKDALDSIKSENFNTFPESQIQQDPKINLSSYIINARIGSKRYSVTVDFKEFDNNELFSTDYKSQEIYILINTKLPLFNVFKQNIELFSIIQKFIVLVVISESWIKETNSRPDGLASPEEIRKTLNGIINQIETDGGHL